MHKNLSKLNIELHKVPLALTRDDRQAGRGDRLPDPSALFVRQLKVEAVSQSRELGIQDRLRTFQNAGSLPAQRCSVPGSGHGRYHRIPHNDPMRSPGKSPCFERSSLLPSDRIPAYPGRTSTFRHRRVRSGPGSPPSVPGGKRTAARNIANHSQCHPTTHPLALWGCNRPVQRTAHSTSP